VSLTNETNRSNRPVRATPVQVQVRVSETGNKMVAPDRTDLSMHRPQCRPLRVRMEAWRTIGVSQQAATAAGGLTVGAFSWMRLHRTLLRSAAEPLNR
jgi:hypothetical protein